MLNSGEKKKLTDLILKMQQGGKKSYLYTKDSSTVTLEYMDGRPNSTRSEVSAVKHVNCVISRAKVRAE